MDKKALYPNPYIDPEKHYCVAGSIEDVGRLLRVYQEQQCRKQVIEENAAAKGLSVSDYLWQLVEADR